MNERQKRKIRQIQDRLVEMYIVEADPASWPTKDTIIQELQADLDAGHITPDKANQELHKRLTGLAGRRYWLKKNANQTASMILRADSLVAGEGEDGNKADQTKEIRDMERAVEKRIPARTRPKLVVDNR